MSRPRFSRYRHPGVFIQLRLGCIRKPRSLDSSAAALEKPLCRNFSPQFPIERHNGCRNHCAPATSTFPVQPSGTKPVLSLLPCEDPFPLLADTAAKQERVLQPHGNPSSITPSMGLGPAGPQGGLLLAHAEDEDEHPGASLYPALLNFRKPTGIYKQKALSRSEPNHPPGRAQVGAVSQAVERAEQPMASVKPHLDRTDFQLRSFGSRC